MAMADTSGYRGVHAASRYIMNKRGLQAPLLTLQLSGQRHRKRTRLVLKASGLIKYKNLAHL